MGSGVSTFQSFEIERNSMIQDLLNENIQEDDDEWWNEFYSFSCCLPKSRFSWDQFMYLCDVKAKWFPTIAILCRNKDKFHKVLDESISCFSKTIDFILDETADVSKHIYVQQCSNILFVVQILVKYCNSQIENQTTSSLIRYVGCENNRVNLLINCLFRVVTELKITNEWSYTTQVHALSTFILLIHHDTTQSTVSILTHIHWKSSDEMWDKQTHLTQKLISNIINVEELGSPSKYWCRDGEFGGILGNSCHQISIIVSLAHSIMSVVSKILLSSSDTEENYVIPSREDEESVERDTPLTDLSLLLLLILYNILPPAPPPPQLSDNCEAPSHHGSNTILSCQHSPSLDDSSKHLKKSENLYRTLIMNLKHTSTFCDTNNHKSATEPVNSNEIIHAEDNKPLHPLVEINFKSLFNSTSSILASSNCRMATLLLYSLIHSDQSLFRIQILTSSESERIVLPVLKTLHLIYASTGQRHVKYKRDIRAEGSLHSTREMDHYDVYMSLIILLILSEDGLFSKSIHNIHVKKGDVFDWLLIDTKSEKFKDDEESISLGSLVVYVVIRTLQYNMSRIRDKYLHTNCLATLANMSSKFHALHPVVCDSLILLFESVVKKLLNCVRDIVTVKVGDKTKITDNSPEEDDKLPSHHSSDISVLCDTVRTLLEILNSALFTTSTSLRQNETLVYYVLHSRQTFRMLYSSPVCSSEFGAQDWNGRLINVPPFNSLLYNFNVILDYFDDLIQKECKNKDRDCAIGNVSPSVMDTVDSCLDVEEVSEVIIDGIAKFQQKSVCQMADLKFKYVEEEHQEEFFIPYIWSLAKVLLHF